MELVCPSCGNRHRTEEHPNAFEIVCACGYSILVPDEAALAQPVEPDLGFESVPSAFEEGDAPIPLRTPDRNHPDHSSLSPEASRMTPPEELPREMAYDPFELQSPPPPEMTPEVTDSFTPTSQAAPPPSTDDSRHSGQALVNRIQAASMGQLLGEDFDLAWGDLERGILVAVLERVSRFINARPWLEQELRLREIKLESLPDRRSINRIPEVIALEIYLACHELGGQCDVRRSSAHASNQ